jgi:hypothetical protein
MVVEILSVYALIVTVSDVANNRQTPIQIGFISLIKPSDP